MKHIEVKRYGVTEIKICQTEVPHPQAQIANDLMKQLAIVAAVPDGEDAAGRQKLRLMTPEEVVARATNIADLAWKEYRTRGWLLDIPLPTVEKEDSEPPSAPPAGSGSAPA